MKLAIIDIGSNSVRLLLATYENNIWHYEPKQLWTTRLGQRNSDGTLRTESMEASYQAFTEIKKLADQYGVECCFGFATSAVREASNGLEFMDRISEHCPMEWRILTGDEEAIYGFNGALGDQLNDGRHYTTIDIGGGSTELALGNKDGVYWSRSYPVGAVRLQSMSDEGHQRVWEET
ncbi:MAG: phosphatase, partial [Veillonella sp.]|nr:phosphatase [Veillonella sp.]